MEDQVISYETARLLKEKNFQWDSRHYYYNAFGNNELAEFQYYETNCRTYNDYDGYPEDLELMAPTQALLQRWLREVHNIDIAINYEAIGSDDYEYCYIIKYEKGNAKRQCNRIKVIESLQFYSGGYVNVNTNTYEEALELALQEALNLIKC